MNVWKGIVAGAAGGAVGTLVMGRAQPLLAKVFNVESAPPKEGSEPSTVKVAGAISRNVLGRELQPRHKQVAGQTVHWAMGTLSGALYGGIAEVVPLASAGAGTLFGSAVWAGADEIALPALGFSEPPAAFPPHKHAQWLAAHFVYGAVTDGVRRLIRHWW